MKIAIASFTRKGYQTAAKISEGLSGVASYEIIGDYHSYPKTAEKKESLAEWVKRMFFLADALVYVGACGIAVRSIAPYVKDKFTDPGVLVVDEAGQFCISLLSGHVGGANRFCHETAKMIGAIPVVTTATDVNSLFAVDEFAARNQLFLSDRDTAKRISAALLEGDIITLFDEENKFKTQGDHGTDSTYSSLLSQGIQVVTDRSKLQGELGIYLGIHEVEVFSQQLDLIPANVVLGIGCKKETDQALIFEFADEILKKWNIHPKALKQGASIDLKKEEMGLLAFFRERGIPFLTYTAEELARIEDVTTESEFVRSVTGIGNVCERAALSSSGHSSLIAGKQARNGITIALAEEEWSIRI
ncbi:MAG: cobalt-precorrin 5A hydrolase [Lachnospiraceae bacterium]